MIKNIKNHKVWSGDSLKFLKDLDDDSIDLIVTDPPYDIKNTKAGGNSRLSRSIQGMNDQIENDGIVSGFDQQILKELVRVNKNINMYFFCNKEQIPMYLKYFVFDLGCSFDIIKWVKTNATPTFNNKYLSDTEYCLYFRKKGYCNPNSYEDASTLYHAPINQLDKKKYGHPTIKPIQLVTKLIKNSTRKGDTVLDPFVGSGTTAVCCENEGRNFIGGELLEKYHNMTVERLNEVINQNDLFKSEYIAPKQEGLL